MPGKLILCEPQCRGYQHVCFNSALLKTALLAFPDRQILFAGEEEHIEWLKRALPADAQAIDWQPLSIPHRSGGAVRILPREQRWIRTILDMALENDADAVLFCSVTNSGLLTLKTNLLFRRLSMPVVAVPHAVLRTALDRSTWNPWRRLTSMRTILRLPHPPNLTYIALGDSIYGYLVDALPVAASCFHVLDMPFLWARKQPPNMPGAGQPVRFGYLGASYLNKGFEAFHDLARHTRRTAPNSEFIMAGFLADCADCSAYEQDVVGVGSSPLPEEEFAKRAGSLTYAVFTANPERYRLVASASFLDSLSYITPGIYLRNPFIESYFKRMGDIGTMCDSYEEMRDTVEALAMAFPAERYRNQCANILENRELFSPETLAPRLREIVGG